MALAKELVTDNRPLRLRLDLPGGANEDMLLPQRVYGSESICGGIEYRVLCVSVNAQLPLKQLIAVSAVLEFVTDRGGLRSVCGIVTEASSGDSDGGLASYQLVLRDALAILEKRSNTRVFRNMNEMEIVQRILNEWRQKSPLLGTCFNHEVDEAFSQRSYPKREFTMQYNESDAAFIRRLLKRRGICWYIRAADAGHTLVLFNSADSLRQNAAGTIRYHRDNATEERDTITAWSAVRSLQPGTVTRHSWDYMNPQGRDFMLVGASSGIDQGVSGNELAASLDDYQILPPHAGDDNEDLFRLGQLRMSRHDYESKCFHGEGSVRDLCAGEYFTLAEHPEVDAHPPEERDFVVTALQVLAQNNLPQALAARVERLFTRSRWVHGGGELDMLRDMADKVANGPVRMHIQFIAVRRGVPIVSAFDPRIDVPQAQMQSAIVVGPDGEEVHCDQLGRVKIRFPGTRLEDHEEAAGSGASDTETDSAWVRVASNWAGNGPGALQQCGTLSLPRIGTEVLVTFLGGDPDKPIIIAQIYNQDAPPISLSNAGALPGNRYLSGIKSREFKDGRSSQLCFDDTQGEISVQLASDHGNTQLNLGFLTEPKANGYGASRGEGAELASDEQIVLRAAKGILLSAWQRTKGDDKQMARHQFLELMGDCTELIKSLGESAGSHQAKGVDTSEQESLHAAFSAWEAGSNTLPAATGGGRPMIAISAPAGISFASPKSIVSYAGTCLNIVAQRNLQMTAGERATLNAGRGISMFAQGDGIDLIAHQGKLLIQTQRDETELNSAKDVKLTATEGKIYGMAKEIVLIAEDGSFIKIGGGITLGTNGTITHHGSSFPFKGSSTMTAVLPKFESGSGDAKFQARYYAHMDGGVPAPDLDIVSTVSDGSSKEERSDNDGKTQLIERGAMHQVTAKAMKNQKV
ncbi:type VI secretion system tip protein VgrG [Duganella sp. sic0402]|nr:type VI secretion system Vgr family protein [Duganella sp. sic0402]MBV7539263.1 type VI secretion system tip protein VgrG [Duganella sp. sic0402]